MLVSRIDRETAVPFTRSLILRQPEVPEPCRGPRRERHVRSNLIRMANDIAIFHRSFAEDEAMQMVSEHINKFWAPSMRRQLFEGFQKEPAAFDKLVARSLGKISCKTYNPIVPEIRELSGTGG